MARLGELARWRAAMKELAELSDNVQKLRPSCFKAKGVEIVIDDCGDALLNIKENRLHPNGIPELVRYLSKVYGVGSEQDALVEFIAKTRPVITALKASVPEDDPSQAVLNGWMERCDAILEAAGISFSAEPAPPSAEEPPPKQEDT